MFRWSWMGGEGNGEGSVVGNCAIKVIFEGEGEGGRFIDERQASVGIVDV